MTEAIHGLGTADDEEFHKLRLSMFLNDTIIFLIEHCEERNKLFIMLEKKDKINKKSCKKTIELYKKRELSKYRRGKLC